MEQTKPRHYIVPMIISLLILGLISWAILSRQLIYDFVVGFNYRPSFRMSRMLTDLSLTPEMERIARASRPLSQTATQFNQNCVRKEPGNYILGCYNGDQVFVYAIKNSELEKAEEVTLAHELLHAAYTRLSASERKRIDKLLAADYQRLKDEKLAKRMDFYKRTEPGQFHNELHSILGTELSGINPQLERYYGRYFSDRSQIVKFNDDYNQQFEQLEQKRQQLSRQMDQLKAEFDTINQQYRSQSQILANDIRSFNARAQSGQFDSTSEFYAERAELGRRQSYLENQYAILEQKNQQYNQLVDQYNQTIENTNRLSKDLDSYAPIPKL